jgi:RES domain-containing protein
VPALYLALTIMTAVKEANQGFAHRIDPCVLCSYEVDCDDVVDLTTDLASGEFAIALEDMACAWATALSVGERPASWSIYDRLRPRGVAGIVVPSFSPSAQDEDRNLVLWDWGPDLPHKVTVFDPSGRLPKDQLSWA